MYYRALISVPISADDDEEAMRIAGEHALSLRRPGSEVVVGHVEMVATTEDGSLAVRRVVFIDPGFNKQIP
jgi:hypothetical protein